MAAWAPGPVWTGAENLDHLEYVGVNERIILKCILKEEMVGVCGISVVRDKDQW